MFRGSRTKNKYYSILYRLIISCLLKMNLRMIGNHKSFTPFNILNKKKSKLYSCKRMNACHKISLLVIRIQLVLRQIKPKEMCQFSVNNKYGIAWVFAISGRMKIPLYPPPTPKTKTAFIQTYNMRHILWSFNKFQKDWN